jgi:hypothetical protein
MIKETFEIKVKRFFSMLMGPWILIRTMRRSSDEDTGVVGR